MNNVGVKLYKVDGPDGSIDGLTPYATAVTSTVNGEDGIYWFNNLPEGYYVVVFDTTTLVKEDEMCIRDRSQSLPERSSISIGRERATPGSG